tara:strand:+ start:1567 stop:2592 length:1026 start_codon:yes stop_codon:yes gene_type:complete
LAADIGSITELKGVSRVVRDKAYDSTLNFALQSMDVLETANGRMGVTFADESVIRLTEQSKITIDNFVYDPDPDKSSLALNFVKGTGRFITSKTKRIKKENIKIRTNSATIGIRGTDFTITVSETGALVILLPDEFGNSSGEIVVTTALGQVVLNQPYEATTVYNFETAPTPSVILDLTLSMIDNMLIVNPPDEVETIDDSKSTNAVNLLDVDFLEFDELEKDELQEDNLEYTELDIDALQVNFLEDLLDVIQEVDELNKANQSLAADGIKGTAIGFDADTQINTFVNDNEVKFIRNVQDSIQMSLSRGDSTTVIMEQEGKVNRIAVNGGSSSTINIRQGS